MKKQTMLMLVGLLLGVAACGKYEEGPGLSLRSKTARVANEWRVEYAYDHKDKVEITADFTGESWVFGKDGVFMEKEGGVTDKTGTWEFMSDKEEIAIMVGTDIDKYTILRLKENEMWLRDAEEELHLISVE
ncbi:MAG: hypothetical protein KY428_03995 [Bacteroidetes bacterium]|nr:hypothetical protein [Bacteroidota bacterium]